MRAKRGFTIIELMVAVIIISILCAAGWVAYSNSIWNAKRTEALTNVGAIRVAENLHKMNTGAFVPAGNITEINDALGLNLEAKYYTYRVINVTPENFLVVAELIASDAINDLLLLVSMAVVSDSYGFILEDNEQYLDNTGTNGYGDGTGGGGTGGGGSAGGGTGGGGSTPPASPGGGSGIIRDPGGLGGGSVIGGGGGTGGGTGGGGAGGGGTGGGGTTGGGIIPIPPIYDTDLTTALNLLQGVTLNDVNMYELIQSNNIDIIYESMDDGTLGYWWGIEHNTIYINEALRTLYPATAVAAIIAHEATHADYEYNSPKWINSTLEAHPELTSADLHIPGNSIDQEYNAFSTEIQVWNQIKGSDTNDEMDGLAAMYAQGEEYLKGVLRVAYAEYDLDEF